jgi:hypothetical protein
VLSAARAAGWTLRYIDAPHRFGDVFCPGGEDGVRCSFMVDKTAKGGETKSREALKLIRGCGHGSVIQGSKARTRQEECLRLLDHADRLIDIAATGLAAAEAQQAAWAELERIQTQLESAEANLAEVLREEEDTALQAVYDTDDAPTPSDIADTLDDALIVVANGESAATALKVRKPRLAKPFLDRVQQARTRVAELRVRLENLL